MVEEGAGKVSPGVSAARQTKPKYTATFKYMEGGGGGDLSFVNDLIETNKMLMEKIRQLVRVVRAHEAVDAEKAIQRDDERDELLREVDDLL